MVGEHCRVEEGTVLEDVIVWDGVTIRTGTTLRRCVVGDGACVSGHYQDEVLVV